MAVDCPEPCPDEIVIPALGASEPATATLNGDLNVGTLTVDDVTIDNTCANPVPVASCPGTPLEIEVPAGATIPVDVTSAVTLDVNITGQTDPLNVDLTVPAGWVYAGTLWTTAGECFDAILNPDTGEIRDAATNTTVTGATQTNPIPATASPLSGFGGTTIDNTSAPTDATWTFPAATGSFIRSTTITGITGESTYQDPFGSPPLKLRPGQAHGWVAHSNSPANTGTLTVPAGGEADVIWVEDDLTTI